MLQLKQDNKNKQRKNDYLLPVTTLHIFTERMFYRGSPAGGHDTFIVSTFTR